jgi:hypothetical protein
MLPHYIRLVDFVVACHSQDVVFKSWQPTSRNALKCNPIDLGQRLPVSCLSKHCYSNTQNFKPCLLHISECPNPKGVCMEHIALEWIMDRLLRINSYLTASSRDLSHGYPA